MSVLCHKVLHNDSHMTSWFIISVPGNGWWLKPSKWTDPNITPLQQGLHTVQVFLIFRRSELHGAHHRGDQGDHYCRREPRPVPNLSSMFLNHDVWSKVPLWVWPNGSACFGRQTKWPSNEATVFDKWSDSTNRRTDLIWCSSKLG